MICPNFLYIGIARAGSTWLFEALKSHPEIFVPPAKDLYFFDKHYDKGLDWYFGFFSGATEARAIGEMSHDYYFSEVAAKRIKKDLPDAKIICCLREPVDRLRSGYAYNQTTDLDDTVSLEDYIDRPGIRRQYDYHRHVKLYFDLFGREKVLVVFYEDLKSDPDSFIQSVYSFLGVDETFTPPLLNERVNAARDARSGWLALFAYRVALLLRGLGMANFIGRIKQSPLINRILYQAKVPEERGVTPVPPEVIAELRKDNGALETLLGRPLPEVWDA